MLIRIYDTKTNLEHVATNWATFSRMLGNFSIRYSSDVEEVTAAIGRIIDAMYADEAEVILTFETLFQVEFDFELG